VTVILSVYDVHAYMLISLNVVSETTTFSPRCGVLSRRGNSRLIMGDHLVLIAMKNIVICGN